MRRSSPSTTDKYVTMHTRMSRSYAAALDLLCDRLSFNRSELLEAMTKEIAKRKFGIDMPPRLPDPAEASYEQYLKVS